MPEVLPQIKGLVEATLIDYPGRIACAVFLGGCNLRCRFCHAAHLVFGHQRTEAVPIEAVLNRIDRSDKWIDAVVVSGGEPTCDPGLEDLLQLFKQRGLSVKLDTNGTHPEVLERIIEAGLVDAVAMDIKAPLDGRYHEITGVPVDLEALRQSVQLLLEGRVDYEFRTTVVEGWHDVPMIETIARRDIAGASRYFLQAFRAGECIDPALSDVHSPNLDVLEEMLRLAAPHVGQCSIRGYED